MPILKVVFGAGAMVNDQEKGAMTLPAASLAPLILAVKVVLGANGADGMNVTRFVQAGSDGGTVPSKKTQFFTLISDH